MRSRERRRECVWCVGAPPSVIGARLSRTPVLLVLTPDFFHRDALVAEVTTLLQTHEHSAFVTLYSTAMPFDEYLCIAAATVEGQRLQELGLFDLFFAKWPSGTELQAVAAKEAVLNLTEPTKKFSERLKSAFEGDTTFMDAGMVVSAKVQSRKISIAEEETDGGERERRGTTNKRSSAVRTRANSSVGEGVSPVAGRTHQTSAANVVDPERTRRETMRL